MLIKLRSTVRLVLLAAVFVVSYFSLFSISSVGLKYNTRESVIINYKLLLSRVSSGTPGIAEKNDFNEKLETIVKQTLATDYTPPLSFLRPDYDPPTEIEIPSYFLDSGPLLLTKQGMQPYDPRFTRSVYLSWIEKTPEQPVPFHWSDWVDLSALRNYLRLSGRRTGTCRDLYHTPAQIKRSSLSPPVEEFCVDDWHSPLGFKITGFPGAQSRDRARLLAKAYLYTSFPAPARLIFMTNDHGSYQVDVIDRTNDLKSSLLWNKMPESFLEAKPKNMLDVLECYKSLLGHRPPDHSPCPDPAQIHVAESWFDVNIDERILCLESSTRTKADDEYLESLKYSKLTETPEKSFREAKILDADQESTIGDHYDWRFFDGITINTERQVPSLHRLLKNYLQFCRTHGLVTWIAHGSLLSWYWNGMGFPWDADTDVQMPLRDLHRLAHEFNQSFVIENVGHDLSGKNLNETKFNGLGGFFVDIGNSITHRTGENGLNNIDARFIDVHTGLYVDITGLALSEEKAPSRYDNLLTSSGNLERNKDSNEARKLFNCRNRHFVSLAELTPLVKSIVQNEIGYIPHNFTPMLEHEYGLQGMVEPHFKEYYYLRSLRVWVKTEVLLKYLGDPISWVNAHRDILKRDLSMAEIKLLGNLTETDLINLLYDMLIFSDFANGREFKAFHEKQMRNFLSGRMDNYYSNIQKYTHGGQVSRAIWGDLQITEIAFQDLKLKFNNRETGKDLNAR